MIYGITKYIPGVFSSATANAIHQEAIDAYLSTTPSDSIFGALPTDPGLPTVTGTTYYVDAINGNDANDGLSEATAWQTLGKVNGFTPSPGDAVLFKRGQTWTGTLSINGNGTAGNYIIYGAYGTGEHPIITTIQDQSITWTSLGGNIWESVETFVDPQRLFRNGVEIMRSVDDGTGTNEPLGKLVPDLVEWTRTAAGNLQVYGDPTGDTFSFATVQDTIYTYDKSYMILYGLDIRGGYESGLKIFHWSDSKLLYCKLSNQCYYGVRYKNTYSQGTNFTVESCIIDSGWSLDYSQAGINSFSWRGAREGIYVSGTHSNFTYKNSWFKNGQHSAMNLWADGGTITNTKILNNYFTSPNIPYGGRIAMEGVHDTYEIAYNVFENQRGCREQLEGQNGHIHHNIWINIKDSDIDSAGAEGVCIRMGDWYGTTRNNIIENNLFYECEGALDIGGTGTFAAGRGLELITIQNNIFYNCSQRDVFNEVPVYLRNATFNDYTTNITVKNNLAYSTANTLFGSYGAGKVDVATFESQANADTSTASGNLFNDPLFVDGANKDFNLQSGSPAIGAGVLPTATIDYAGSTIASPYNIGIYDQPKA